MVRLPWCASQKGSVSRMTLVRRMSLSFAGVLLLTVLAGGYVLHALDRLAEGVSEQRRISRALEHANFLEAAALRANVLIEQYVDIPDRAKLDELRTLREAAAARRAALRSLTEQPRITALLDSFESIQPRRRELADRVIEASESGGA